MKIAFVHNQKAFLPEVEAYHRFFASYGIDCTEIRPEALKQTAADVEWFFMGSDFSTLREGRFRIHEYVSASVPPYRKFKDLVKSFFNTQPDYRLFQNAFVKDCFHFRDQIPFGFRDMGISADWLQPPAKLQKTIDFIYVGKLHNREMIRCLLDHFSNVLKDKTLLLVSRDYQDWATAYRNFEHIRFIGPVPQETVRAYLHSSRYALNLIPDLPPYNQQTPTKLLEYLACRIPVISTRNAWMNSFQQQSGGRYFYLEPDLSNLNEEKLGSFDFQFPDLSGWTWEQQIRKSGILDVFKNAFPEYLPTWEETR